MELSNDIVLSPRFKLELGKSKSFFLEAFELEKKLESDFIINRIDDHVFIKFPKNKQHF